MIGGEVAGVFVTGAVSASLAGAGMAWRKRAGGSRAARAEATVRPILYDGMERGEFDPRVLAALTSAERHALDSLARSLLPKVRGSDQEALGRLLDRRGYVDDARRRSHSRRARVRARAGEFLGNSGSPAAVGDLVPLLRDPDPQVRWAAARGLGRLGHAGALSPLLSSLEGPRALPVDLVADAIIQIRDCPMSVLRQGLQSRSVPTRALTVELLGRFQALAASDDIVGLLHRDPSVEVRARAARALGRMGSPRSVDALLASIDDGPLAMRVQAVWALGEIGDPRTAPVLARLLVGPTRQLTDAAAVALAAMGAAGVDVLEHAAKGEGHAAAVSAQALTARSELEPSHR